MSLLFKVPFCVPKELVHNQLMGIGCVAQFAKRFHRTGMNESPVAVAAAAAVYADGLNLDRASVLELGPGQTLGVSALLREQFSTQAFAIDISRYHSDEEATARGVQYSLYDGVNMPYEDDFFDCVVSSDVFEHVRQPVALLAEIYRTLKPGGICRGIIDLRDHFFMPRPDKWFNCHKYSDRLWAAMTSNRSNYVNRFICSDWEKAFVETGFSVVEIERFETDPEVYADKAYLASYSKADLSTYRICVTARKPEG